MTKLTRRIDKLKKAAKKHGVRLAAEKKHARRQYAQAVEAEMTSVARIFHSHSPKDTQPCDCRGGHGVAQPPPGPVLPGGVRFQRQATDARRRAPLHGPGD